MRRKKMKDICKINRRYFLQAGLTVGGGLILGMYFSDQMGTRGAGAQSGPPGTKTFMPNAFIRIGADDTVAFHRK